MGMQQVQEKSSKWPKRARIILFVCALLGLIAAATFWLLNIQPAVFSSLFAALGVIIGFIALIPIIFPAKTSDPVPPASPVQAPPINIYNVIPLSPAPSLPQSQAESTPQVQASSIPTAPASSFANP